MTKLLFPWMGVDAVLADPARLFALLDEVDSAGLSLNPLDDVEPARKGLFGSDCQGRL
jgi:hypothetical protein